MKSRFSQIAACVILSGAALATTPTTAAESVVAAQADDSAAAKSLLERAVARYRTDGEAALGAFSRAGEFLVGDLYVYVLGADGVMKASGGPSITLVGRNISEFRSTELCDLKCSIRRVFSSIAASKPSSAAASFAAAAPWSTSD